MLGFCTAEGGRTSHPAILARSLTLPAVVGAGAEVLAITEGETVALDGTAGTVLVSPDSDAVARYEKRQKCVEAMLKHAQGRADHSAITRDRHQVEVVASIANVEGSGAAIAAGAEGVGLLRTEFLYLEQDHLPSEEKQYHAYRAIVDVFDWTLLKL